MSPRNTSEVETFANRLAQTSQRMYSMVLILLRFPLSHKEVYPPSALDSNIRVKVRNRDFFPDLVYEFAIVCASKLSAVSFHNSNYPRLACATLTPDKGASALRRSSNL